jgi:hypothetical protein
MYLFISSRLMSVSHEGYVEKIDARRKPTAGYSLTLLRVLLKTNYRSTISTIPPQTISEICFI